MIRQHNVSALLMGGQACVLYGAAEYSRDLDLAVLSGARALPRLATALQALNAKVIAVPPFEKRWLDRGHAVHFSIPGDSGRTLRVDVMSQMRGVDAFADLWDRRLEVELPAMEGSEAVPVAVMALEDLVCAKKTQRDKDWPMIRRLVDASYVAGREDARNERRVRFWLSELRSPEFLAELVTDEPQRAAESRRPAVIAARNGDDVSTALAAEQQHEMAADRAYWAPLRRELEQLRHEARRGLRDDTSSS
ncbi:MAG: hypothetical protein MUF00_05140 [Gemmatimonadaceae bacterium]|jgi:hypothetical protein|nr:hypothetical protein [Gemmatimonadaceae bacterium]